MRILDLSHPFNSSMPAYPGDPEPVLHQIQSVDTDGFTNHELTTSMHVGTHIDAPLHMIAGGKTLGQFPIDRFIGRGALIDARKEKKEISASVLDGVQQGSCDIALVLTGHAATFRDHYRTDGYYSTHPQFSESFAHKIVELGIRIVGMDMPSPDHPPFPAHKILLGNDVLIIENLLRLESLIGLPTFTVAALPLALDTDAAPVRVVAMIE